MPELFEAQKNIDYRNSPESDKTLMDLYKSSRKWMYMGIAFVGFALVFCLFLSWRDNHLEVENEMEEVHDGKTQCIVEDGSFVSAYEVYRRMKVNMRIMTGDAYVTNMDGEGGLGFYKDGDQTYTFTIACLDKNHEYLEYHKPVIPTQVIFYDYTTDTPNIMHMAYFVETLFKDMTYKEAVDQLRDSYEGKMQDSGNTQNKKSSIEFTVDGRKLTVSIDKAKKRYSLTADHSVTADSITGNLETDNISLE